MLLSLRSRGEYVWIIADLGRSISYTSHGLPGLGYMHVQWLGVFKVQVLRHHHIVITVTTYEFSSVFHYGYHLCVIPLFDTSRFILCTDVFLAPVMRHYAITSK